MWLRTWRRAEVWCCDADGGRPGGGVSCGAGGELGGGLPDGRRRDLGRGEKDTGGSGPVIVAVSAGSLLPWDSVQPLCSLMPLLRRRVASVMLSLAAACWWHPWCARSCRHLAASPQ